jgi:kynureninase
MRDAAQLDSADSLRALRGEFHLPVDPTGKPLTYLCGHSLGLQPRAAQSLLQEELDAWGRLGVEGHFSGKRPWVSYHEQLTKGFAALAGARPHEVVAMNSLSVNLHLLLASFYRPTRERHKILIESGSFPSDRYAVMSQIAWHGFDPADSLIEATPRPGEATLREADVCELIEREGASIATVLWPGVQYLTGQSFDIAGIAAVARKHGCTVGVDLAHAIGNVPLKLHDCGVDFAVWCGYKYLNGGPGAIGGAFVHDRHAHAFDLPRLAGWWGHDPASRFAMPHDFAPQAGAAGWQISNPPIFAMTPLIASLDLFARAGMDALRAKSLRLAAFLRDGAAQIPAVRILTPGNDASHGSQVSLAFNLTGAQLTRLRQYLHAAGIVCDWREPDVLRAAPVPLYNTFADVETLIVTLKTALSGAVA